MKMITRLMLVIAFTATFSTASLFAQKNDPLAIELTAHKIVSKEGKENKIAAEKAKPGDLVEYTAVYANKSSGGLRNLEPNLPIPQGTTYIADSAKPAPAQASLDGVAFKNLPIKRKVKTADGKEVEEVVPASEYRALRWFVGDLPAGKNVTVSARVKVQAGVARLVK